MCTNCVRVCVCFHFQGLLNDERRMRLFFIGIIKLSTSPKTSHYDIPKIHDNDENIIFKSNGDVEKLLVNEQNNKLNTNDKVSMHFLFADFFFLSVGLFFTNIKRTR